jgi:hypothetical protein
MKNEPAFPGPNKTGFQEGMTKREFFAIHAPAEVPEWFKHSMPRCPYCYDLRGEISRLTIEQDRKDAELWMEADYELPEHLNWLQEKVKKNSDEISKWHYENNIQRIFQWRIFFADTLLKNLNETTAEPLPDSGKSKA